MFRVVRFHPSVADLVSVGIRFPAAAGPGPRSPRRTGDAAKVP